MRKLLILGLTVFALSACNSDKDKEKALLDDVIKIHDKVMAQEEKLMQNKMLLDTLMLKTTDSTEKASMNAVSDKLIKADGEMENWMQNFDATQKGKSHEQIVKYLEAQKKQVISIDSQITQAVKESDNYLVKRKK